MPATSATEILGLTASAPRKDLYEGVQTVARAVSTRSPLPILSHVLLRRDGDSGLLTIAATDLEMWIEHTLPQSQESMGGLGTSGAATAPARNLAELLSAMPEANVELSAESSDKVANALHLRCNRANYKLLGLPAEEFPLLPTIKDDIMMRVARVELREMIRQTLFAVSTDDSRAILTGILLEYKEGRLRCVATDTHRLAVRSCAVPDGPTEPSKSVVPARAMQEVLRILGSGDEGLIEITVADNQVQFRIADEATKSGTTIISRLIDGQFPSYERVVPSSFDRKLTIERDALLAALKRAFIVAREGSANRVFLRTAEDDAGEDKLTITAQSGNLGDAFEEIEVARDKNEPGVEIAFNAKYLIDVLNVLDSTGLYLEMTESTRPGVVRPTEDDNYFCVLMPMQVV